MDSTTKTNQQKWDELVRLEVPCSRPYEDLTPEIAQTKFNRDNILGDLKGKNVLCLASGGGQQSIGFAMLGAQVTVVDFSEEQLKKDKLEADKYCLDITIVQADMRDLSQFEDQTFDVVYQPYSINYIPEVKSVFQHVSRILKPGGIYHLMFHNPFVHGSWKDSCWGSQWDTVDLWHGIGYPLTQAYKDGLPIKVADQTWNFEDTQGKVVRTSAPQEFKHTLSTILNTLTENKMSLLKFEEYTGDPNKTSIPGTWDHYASVAAPWLFLWARKIQ